MIRLFGIFWENVGDFQKCPPGNLAKSPLLSLVFLTQTYLLHFIHSYCFFLFFRRNLSEAQKTKQREKDRLRKQAKRASETNDEQASRLEKQGTKRVRTTSLP